MRNIGCLCEIEEAERIMQSRVYCEIYIIGLPTEADSLNAMLIEAKNRNITMRFANNRDEMLSKLDLIYPNRKIRGNDILI